MAVFIESNNKLLYDLNFYVLKFIIPYKQKLSIEVNGIRLRNHPCLMVEPILILYTSYTLRHIIILTSFPCYPIHKMFIVFSRSFFGDVPKSHG